MDSGLVFGDAISFDPAQIAAAPLTYDTILVDDLAPPPSQPAPPRYEIVAQLLQTLSLTGAAARAAPRRTGQARFANDTAAPGATVRPLAWVVTPLGDGPPATTDPNAKTWSELIGSLATLNAGQARWQLAPAYELEA
jgi:hypothetical protein